MNPASILVLIQGIEAALAAAPQIEAIAIKAKDFISALFTHGVITVDQQNALHAHVDAICAARLAGEIPPHWQVEPDPV